jgi:membrane protease YdiL (CAAX protease family)
MAQITIAKLPPPIRIVIFLGGLVIVWLPFALPLYWLSGQGRLPGGDLAPTALLYIGFLILVPRWGRYIHHIHHPWAWLGLTGGLNLFQSFAMALGLGLAGIGLLVGVQVWFGWATLKAMTDLAPDLPGIILGGALTALAVGWAEEILFRGWLLRELERGWSLGLALMANSLIFALAHFIKPPAVMLQMLPQFFGLFMLGMVLVWARRIPINPNHHPSHTALGYAAGLHTGLVWGYYLVSVGEVMQPTGIVPPWVTGLAGNPLAGLLGLGLLGGLGVITFYGSHRLYQQPR